MLRVETDEHAWLSLHTLAFLAAGVAVLAAFVAVEARRAEPMLPLEFFRRRSFSAANATNGLLYAAFAATLFFVSLFFQNVKGFSALETGASWLTICVPFFLVAPFGGRIAQAIGARTSVAVGALLGGLGTLGFTLLDAGSPFLLAAPAYLLVGLGYAVAVPAVNAAAIAAVAPERAGIASGVLNSSRQVGAAIGLAALGSVGGAIAADRWRTKVAAFPVAKQDTARGLAKAVAGGDDGEVAERVGSRFVPAAHDAFTSGMRGALLAAGALVPLAGLVTVLGTQPEPLASEGPVAT